LGKRNGGCGLDSSGSGEALVLGSLTHGNEPSGSIKGKEFCDYKRVLLASQGLCSIELVNGGEYIAS
jgi:hypothetical protein